MKLKDPLVKLKDPLLKLKDPLVKLKDPLVKLLCQFVLYALKPPNDFNSFSNTR